MVLYTELLDLVFTNKPTDPAIMSNAEYKAGITFYWLFEVQF